MTVGSLFAGIGGFDLGFERAGFEIKWQVELDPFCLAVLEKHWPEVKRYGDIRRVRAPEPAWVDVVCGGFPCQDVSDSGRRVGIAGKQSGLWREMSRLIGELRPRYVVVENTPGLLDRGMGDVLGDLAGLGYDAEWATLSACAFGAPHVRERVFIVAYPDENRRRASGAHHAQDASATARPQPTGESATATPRFADWTSGPDIPGVVNGVPDIALRGGAIGNSIVPQIAQWIAERIQEADTAA